MSPRAMGSGNIAMAYKFLNRITSSCNILDEVFNSSESHSIFLSRKNGFSDGSNPKTF